MQECQVCGRSFDPLGFQVVVPELGRGFDRIECAHSARTLAGPGSRVPANPLVAITEPFDAALGPAAAGPLSALRPLGTPAATLGLLVVGTAAAALLWLRVLDADPSSFTLGRLSAPPAFGHQTVQTHVEAAPTRTGPVVRKAPEIAAPVTVVKFVTAPSEPAFVAAPGADRPQPSSPPTPARPATRPLPGPAKVIGKGHPKHGKGHSKHGETDGAHSPGHGKAQGKGKKH
jgi:hypothetical protein